MSCATVFAFFAEVFKQLKKEEEKKVASMIYFNELFFLMPFRSFCCVYVWMTFFTQVLWAGEFADLPAWRHRGRLHPGHWRPVRGQFYNYNISFSLQWKQSII